MISSQFDTFLSLLDENLEVLAYDDDGGQSTNAKLLYELPRDGRYIVAASAYSANASGSYRLEFLKATCIFTPRRNVNIRTRPSTDASVAYTTQEPLIPTGYRIVGNYRWYQLSDGNWVRSDTGNSLCDLSQLPAS